MAITLKTPRFVDTLIVHCSASPPSMDIGAKEIKVWHTSPDPNDASKPWKDIGYHFVIRRDGTIEKGRPLDHIGSHVRGHNKGSIGVCLVGGVDEKGKAKSNFTAPQWVSLERILYQFKAEYPQGKVFGHNDFDKGKACPSFSVKKWLAKIGMLD